jgi:hypothetical protein
LLCSVCSCSFSRCNMINLFSVCFAANYQRKQTNKNVNYKPIFL